MDEIRKILEAYKAGVFTLEEAAASLADDRGDTCHLGFANLDLQRQERCGFPEVVYCAGKTTEQSVKILAFLMARYDNVIGTRADQAVYEGIKPTVPTACYDATARMVYQHKDRTVFNGERTIAVITAGTSDIPVAEEAALTATIMGNKVERIYDVGVAGLHRLLARREDICRANVNIVVAGMEGALASVVGGLVGKPVIAVPTSIGYGANFHGLSALLAMLNSCAAGVSVVNIDNGFGAGRMAAMINGMR
ncbi:nickel pincer cofactor biosynthesis protein LarB [Megasphaera vaginalis (ex Bordigoni et al. 2020)]|uniref:nickel pincer cofactor biosynthesis protein LarB n=1 Tax=Megasphaera vaginalis (ex Bordigoni et al. 2020) TaxID=2045301 RepID=UPI000C7D93B9|nr:nickel pincer cofactor biosynthesis protein LarB [Megasphaera vaginalis (ex Bordigoni et al. 2020)]